MATETLSTVHTAGKSVFFCLFNTANPALVFDFSTKTFKTLATAATPQVGANEQTDEGGAGYSAYTAPLNLADVNPSPAVLEVLVSSYEQQGGAPAPLTDNWLGTKSLRIAGGLNTIDGLLGTPAAGYRVRFDANVTSTAGDFVQLTAWLELAGQKVQLGAAGSSSSSSSGPAATCTIICHEHGAGSGVTKFVISTGTPTAWDTFEPVQASPNFDDDRGYIYDVTITYLGQAFTGTFSIPAIGGE